MEKNVGGRDRLARYWRLDEHGTWRTLRTHIERLFDG